MLFKHSMAVWAGDNHVSDAIFGEESGHFPEHGGEITSSAKIMGDLHAAIEDDPQCWNALLQLIIELERLVRSGAWKIAAREKYGIASCRDGIVRIAL